MELNIGHNTTGAGRMQIWKIIMHYSWWSSESSESSGPWSSGPNIVFMTPACSTVWQHWLWRRSEALVSAGGWRHVSQGQPQWSAWPHPVLSSVSNSLVRDAGVEWSGVIPPTPTHPAHCTGNLQPPLIPPPPSCPLAPVTLSQCHTPIYSYCSPLDVWTQCWDSVEDI